MKSGVYFNTFITLLLQAWRRYDTDRSGYIEANELKVKHIFNTLINDKTSTYLFWQHSHLCLNNIYKEVTEAHLFSIS